VIHAGMPHDPMHCEDHEGLKCVKFGQVYSRFFSNFYVGRRKCWIFCQ